MAYEYEDKVIKILKNLGALYNSNINFRMADEVEDVYAKAKAWDNYLADVRERIKFSESTEKDIEKAMQEVVNNYMEDR